MIINSSLVLVDGQRFRGGHNCVDLSTISIDMVQQIEIVKGPFSSLYGSDARGEVINIIITHWGPWLLKAQMKLSPEGEMSTKCNTLSYTATLTFEIP
ncbi:MAG: hypothetical protein FH762_16880 [Firmicutes bacterium]|nr:hypothetical protein [Bacillota bacterium]